MNFRKGYSWAVQIRQVGDDSGESDSIILAPGKDKARQLAMECGGITRDIVWQGWIKYGKTALKRVRRKTSR
jgi:hypothetical protein